MPDALHNLANFMSPELRWAKKVRTESQLEITWINI